MRLYINLLIIFLISLSSIAAKPQEYTFCVISDTHLIEKGHGKFESFPSTKTIVKNVIASKPDFVVHCGDMLHGNNRNNTPEAAKVMWQLFDENVMSPLLGAGYILLVTPGNHDCNYNLEPFYRQREWKLPPNFKLISGKMNSWHALEYQDTLLIFLDAYKVTLDEPQQIWLKKMIAIGATKKAVFIFGHVGLKGSIRHPYDKLTEKGGAEILKSIPYTAYFVSGHHHLYSCSKIGKLYNIVCGQSGGKVPFVKPSWLKFKVDGSKVTFENLTL